MSVVVWDGKSLAVDRGATDGFTMWELEKAWEIGDEVVTGVGPLDVILRLVTWYRGGCGADAFPRSAQDAELIIASPVGLRRITSASPTQINHGLNLCAFGAGRDFAYGALAMGATAEQAVKVACRFSVSCGHGAQVFHLRT